MVEKTAPTISDSGRNTTIGALILIPIAVVALVVYLAIKCSGCSVSDWAKLRSCFTCSAYFGVQKKKEFDRSSDNLKTVTVDLESLTSVRTGG